MAFGDIFNKIKDNTQRFRDKINSEEFQNKFRSPFDENGNLKQSENATESPEVPMTSQAPAVQQSPVVEQVASTEAPAQSEVSTPSETQAPSEASVPTETSEQLPGDQPTGNQIGNTNADVAKAKPGDWLIRSNGQKIILTQADIDWAVNKINQGGKSKKDTKPPLHHGGDNKKAPGKDSDKQSGDTDSHKA